MKDRKNLKIGDWWAPCCIHDLQLIKNAEDLTNANEFEFFRGGWESCAEAVSDLIKEVSDKEKKELLDWYQGEGKSEENDEIAREIQRR